MKNQIIFTLTLLLTAFSIDAQVKGTKLGYIDMEYILKNVPSYTEAQNQLEQKAQKWKQEIESKKLEITKLKEALQAEKSLLTNSLIEERNSEIKYLENEMLDYQQKRFGPNGDLIIQKTALTKPVQDQVFTAIQDIAEAKKYDFIFDKTSDLTMLFAAKRFDISDQVVKSLNRTEKREQLTKKQLQQEAEKEAREEALADNPSLASRQLELDAKKTTRDATLAARLQAIEERKKAAEERKQQLINDRIAKKNGIATITSPTNTPTDSTAGLQDKAKTTANDVKQTEINEKIQAAEERKKEAEANKKAIVEKQKQTLQEREDRKKEAIANKNLAISTIAKNNSDASSKALELKKQQADAKAKALEERQKALDEKRKIALETKSNKKNGTVSETSIKEADNNNMLTNEQTKDSIAKKIVDTKTQILEERNKTLEERKKALEEKRKKILEEREATKKANAEKLKTTNTNNN